MTNREIDQELAHERRDLIKAEKDIREGSLRVDQQQVLIDRLVAQGHNTDQAQTLLLNLQQMLEAWRTHRILIIQRIAVLESGS